MMNSDEVLSVYEEMVTITGQMLQAAGNGDWDRLVDLEGQCAVRVENLKTDSGAAPLTGPKRARKVRILQQLLDHDRQIRDLTNPWMAELSALISSTGAERRLNHAYGA